MMNVYVAEKMMQKRKKETEQKAREAWKWRRTKTTRDGLDER